MLIGKDNCKHMKENAQEWEKNILQDCLEARLSSNRGQTVL